MSSVQLWLFGGAPVDAKVGDLVAVKEGGAEIAEEADVVAWLRARGWKCTKGTKSKVRDPNERVRLSNQCRTILSLLVAAGEAGCWNTDLAMVAIKYTGRISELRGAGYVIEIAEKEPVRGGRRRYVLRNPPDVLEAAS